MDDETLAALSGDWEGKSTSRNNDPTFWKEAALTFEIQPGQRWGTVKGHGLSLWRNMSIEFDVDGRFNIETKEVRPLL